jgi:hypothetical protein
MYHSAFLPGHVLLWQKLRANAAAQAEAVALALPLRLPLERFCISMAISDQSWAVPPHDEHSP